MEAKRKDTQLTIRMDTELLEQAKERCQKEGVTVSFVIRAALQDFVKHGMEVRIRRQPPEDEDTERFF